MISIAGIFLFEINLGKLLAGITDDQKNDGNQDIRSEKENQEENFQTIGQNFQIRRKFFFFDRFFVNFLLQHQMKFRQINCDSPQRIFKSFSIFFLSIRRMMIFRLIFNGFAIEACEGISRNMLKKFRYFSKENFIFLTEVCRVLFLMQNKHIITAQIPLAFPSLVPSCCKCRISTEATISAASSRIITRKYQPANFQITVLLELQPNRN